MPGWFLGQITMGGLGAEGVLPQMWPFKGGEYGLNWNVINHVGIAYLYKIVPAPTPTGLTWIRLPSFVTWDAGPPASGGSISPRIVPALSLDDSTIIFTEVISIDNRTYPPDPASSQVVALRVLKRTGDTIALTGPQQIITVGSTPFSPQAAYSQQNGVVRVSPSSFARMTLTPYNSSGVESLTARIYGMTVSGSTISVSSVSTSPAFGDPGIFSSSARHYDGNGHLIGRYFFDFAFTRMNWEVLDWTVGGSVTGVHANEDSSRTYQEIQHGDDSPDAIFGVQPGAYRATTLSGLTVVSAPYPNLSLGVQYPNEHQSSPYLRTNLGFVGSNIGYALYTQSGLSVTPDHLVLIDTGIGPAFFGYPSAAPSIQANSTARHGTTLAATALLVYSDGNPFGPTAKYVPVAFPTP